METPNAPEWWTLNMNEGPQAPCRRGNPVPVGEEVLCEPVDIGVEAFGVVKAPHDCVGDAVGGRHGGPAAAGTAGEARG